MSTQFMGDIGAVLNSAGVGTSKTATHTTRQASSELDMTDFLTLMVTQLQSQTIDNTTDTSDMLNQLVQMQMITAINTLTDAATMSYASSLVGKEVTIGSYENGELKESVIQVVGTGTYNGDQVVFGDDGLMYNLTEIMAVGRLPDIQVPEETDQAQAESAQDAVESAAQAAQSGAPVEELPDEEESAVVIDPNAVG